ncbi:MAG TPA: DNA topoisomerase (ATP-hydrolyzing) subunit B [Candidatus Hydrothermia bacterium]|nr:DNA topoisomerase (ATP-hydrolyzing) subunit B [Candidatus Hydrothermae bacterium]MDD3649322.1 DNA topoisomerase (ATP-hydrolyzing) subunit B [Candidatus Hydrothermia bacterium]MDD5573370.1 DNA topoisomerase (ATP-hydrolyzing) subunit B [Candidatus Hydrothermia bacterium]HOK22737.1 DNA topoisomerase (ATP-hydrolyzing) subunit B [Candidatus Hydrothermia bacterium]HOL23446.1 DNA topoisomerase (ATP-hydrolyzing) subunit B [Candidatus Hydrothermia bacterium]
MDEKKFSEEQNNYTAREIKVLKGLEGVRMRPAMYIGDTSKQGFHHLVYEIVDNAIDEALAGFCTEISVTIRDDVTITIKDNGRGVPVDKHPEEGVPAVEIVFSHLHAGGKFGSKAYAISGGLHGVGASVVNALSEYFEAKIFRDGKIYRIVFSRGKKIMDLQEIGETEEHGTEVTFKADSEIFKNVSFDYELLSERLKELAYLVKGTKIKIKDERTGASAEYLFEGGLREFLKELDEGQYVINEKPFYQFRKFETENVEIEVALEYNKGYEETLISFANTINTTEHGTHVTGLRAGLTRAINDFARRNNFIKENQSFAGEDLREGLTAIIHVKLPDPQFEGQTKTKLGNTYIGGLVTSIVYEEFTRYLEENPVDARIIIEKCLQTQRAREAARKAKELERKKSSFDSNGLAGKLADCTTKDRSRAELFIVEGESAGGSAKQGRNREFQAILPLRGKTLNIEKASIEKVLENEQISILIHAIGSDVHEKCAPDKSRYSKIIIMTDADVDGSHIRTLLLTFFYRYMQPLIEAGYIFVAQPPLYKVKAKKEEKYIYTEEELQEFLKVHEPENVTIQRYKGLGEMNPDQLWETTMDPEKRLLKRITLEDAARASKLINILMGPKVEPRKKYIMEHASLVTNLDI